MIPIKMRMNKRDQLLRKARKTKDDGLWREYKRERNKCNNEVKKAKASFHQQLLNDTRQNPRKFWKAIKSIFFK